MYTNKAFIEVCRITPKSRAVHRNCHKCRMWVWIRVYESHRKACRGPKTEVRDAQD